MKKKLAILTGISVFLGAGYAAWTYSPLGRAALSMWLLKKWEELATNQKKTIDTTLLGKELKKLNYTSHYLLAKYTFLYSPEKVKRTKAATKKQQNKNVLLSEMEKEGVFKKANLKQLQSILFTT